MKRTLTRAAALTAAAALSTAALTACQVSSTEGLSSGSNGGSASTGSGTGSAAGFGSSKSTPTPKPEKPAEKEVRGCSANEKNKETAIKEGIDLGPITLNVLYFQPGQMMAGSPMLPYDKSAAHLEVDTKITEEGTNWGYSQDETPANMDIKYSVKDASGNEVASGKLMEMNAGDGSHYGTNIAEGAMSDGKYTLELTVGHPMMYALHKDLITGVKADAWWATKTVTMDWDYKTPVKDDKPVRNCDVPAYQPKVENLVASSNPNKKPTINPETDWMVPGKGKCSEPEINIGSVEVAPMSLDVNYFQPGGMLDQWLDGTSEMPLYQDSIAHLEADVKMVDGAKDAPVGANASDYGYSNDETPANLNIEYVITAPDGTKVDSGRFMEMNAVDGSHYGTNLRKDIGLKPGTKYTLTFNISHPTNYSLHIDNKTGVAVRHWYKDFSVTMPWHYTGNQVECITTPWWNAFPQPVPAIEKNPALKNES